MKQKNNLFIGLFSALFMLATPFLVLACQTSNNVKSEQGTMMSEGGMVGSGSCSCENEDDSSDRQHEACDADKTGKK